MTRRPPTADRRARAGGRCAAWIVLAWGAGAGWAGAAPDLDTELSIDPASRLAEPSVPRIGRGGAPAEAPRRAWAPTRELLVIDAPEIPAIDAGGDPGVQVMSGRSTTFIDGGLGDDGLITDEAARRALPPGFTTRDGSYDVYDLSLSRDAWRGGPLTLSLIGGVRTVAVQGAAGESEASDAEGFVPVPVVGTGLRLDLTPGLSVTGAASTHTIPDYATMVDFTAQAALQLNPNAVFQAGYQSVYSSVTVDAVNRSFDQEGFFARLRISF